MDNIIEFDKVSKRFSISGGPFSSKSDFLALDNISFSMEKGSSLGIVGESGSGKSTIAKLICNIYSSYSGTIKFLGKDLNSINKQNKLFYHKNVQMVFQDPNNCLNPKLTIRSSLIDGIKKHITKNKSEIEDRLVSLMEKVGLTKEHLDRYPHEFSGGQRQRISIARAISIEPQLLIADEPVSSLDVSVQAQILNLMKELNHKGLGIILISHSLAVVSNMCDNLIVMNKGVLVEKGDTETILTNPKTDYTKSLLKASDYTIIS